MDGSQTEVRGRRRSKKRRDTSKFSRTGGKRGFYLLPFASDVLNNGYGRLKLPLKRFSLAFKTSARNRGETQVRLLAASLSAISIYAVPVKSYSK